MLGHLLTQKCNKEARKFLHKQKKNGKKSNKEQAKFSRLVLNTLVQF